MRYLYTTFWACMTISMFWFLCWNIMICNLSWAGMYCRPTGWKSAWNQILNVPFKFIVSLHACWVSHVRTCSSRHKLTNEMGYGLQPAVCLFTSEKVRNRVWIAVVFALHYSSGEQLSLQVEKSNNGDFDFQPDCLETQSSALMPSTGANLQQTLRKDRFFWLSLKSVCTCGGGGRQGCR